MVKSEIGKQIETPPEACACQMYLFLSCIFSVAVDYRNYLFLKTKYEQLHPLPLLPWSFCFSFFKSECLIRLQSYLDMHDRLVISLQLLSSSAYVKSTFFTLGT